MYRRNLRSEPTHLLSACSCVFGCSHMSSSTDDSVFLWPSSIHGLWLSFLEYFRYLPVDYKTKCYRFKLHLIGMQYEECFISLTSVVMSHESKTFSMSVPLAFNWSNTNMSVQRHTCNANTDQALFYATSQQRYVGEMNVHCMYCMPTRCSFSVIII